MFECAICTQWAESVWPWTLFWLLAKLAHLYRSLTVEAWRCCFLKNRTRWINNAATQTIRFLKKWISSHPVMPFLFFFLSPLLSHPLVFYFKPLCMWILNVKVGTDKSSSLPRRTLLLRRLVCGPGFNSETLWHHTSHICIILYAAASSACRNWFSAAALLSLAVLARALKRQELKQSVPDGAAALDRMRELMCCCALRLVNVF